MVFAVGVVVVAAAAVVVIVAVLLFCCFAVLLLQLKLMVGDGSDRSGDMVTYGCFHFVSTIADVVVDVVVVFVVVVVVVVVSILFQQRLLLMKPLGISSCCW